jgi:hypothetical protein
MMDPTNLYPQLYHPGSIDLTRDLSGPASHFTRTEKPPRYYLIDFGISSRYPGGRPAEDDIIIPGDKSVPEHKGRALRCDPFATDVYLLGNAIRENFLNVSVRQAKWRSSVDFITEILWLWVCFTAH